MPRSIARFHHLALLIAASSACGDKATLVHQDIPSDGICIQASEMFASPSPGPCRPGSIAECTTGSELRVAYDERGIARLKRECAATFKHTPKDASK